MSGTTRLDHALANRGLARSRTAAARLIADGQVTVNGRPIRKPAHQVSAADALEVISPTAAHVSRGALKLIAALDAAGLDPHGRVAIDLGASTGGFTQVLLDRGAREVIAIDVGHDQLAPLLAGDVRVTNLEGVNVRNLTRRDLDGLLARHRDGRTPLHSEAATLVVGDLSFISLRLILPALAEFAPNLEHVILLVKPQFEVGRTQVRGGLVVDASAAADAVVDVVRAARTLGLELRTLLPSPITGTHGNQEYLAWFTPGAAAESATSPHPTEWNDQDERIRSMVTGGTA